MGFISTILGRGTAAPIEAIGHTLDKLFTSDEEREKAAFVLEKLRQHPAELQIELSKVEARSRSVFVAGWRPFIGYVCGMGLAMSFIINPIIQWLSGKPGPELPTHIIINLVLALLGLGTLRTVEKLSGRSF